jgi:mannosyltransferase OCH1-like enzyme
MYLLLSILIIIIIIITTIILISFVNKSKSEKYNLNTVKNESIPKILIQTYKNKNKVPQKVFDNIKKFASDYEYRFFEDKDCINFIKNNFSNDVLEGYQRLQNGAHKADLFRYCYLYINGGVYIDIKTELMKPLNEIFNKNYVYSVLSKVKNTIYQGIIATPPKKELFKKLIDHCVETSKEKIDYYQIFTNHFYKTIQEDLKKIKNPTEGLNKGENYNYFLLSENCDYKQNECHDGLDRYGYCCYIVLEKEKIFKVRYADYPW